MMVSERAASSEQPTVSDRRSVNRSMFWRLIRRSVFANRARLFVILLALGAGAAVTAALLNLQVDAKRRITGEFRSYGANVLVVPATANSTQDSALLNEAVVKVVASGPTSTAVEGSVMLYGLALVRRKSGDSLATESPEAPVVVAGHGQGDPLESGAFKTVEKAPESKFAEDPWVRMAGCNVGSAVAARRNFHVLDVLELRNGERKVDCAVQEVRSFGTSEDDQVAVSLRTAHTLLMLPGAISLVRLRVSGSPDQVDETIRSLQHRLDENENLLRRFSAQEKAFYAQYGNLSQEAMDRVERRLSGAEVRPIRQFTEGEARLYGKISGILTATVAVVLVLTALCVMAAMTNIAAERKNDVGLMKAIGGSVRRVLRIFLAEAALLGLLAGLLGAAAGMIVSIGLGKAVFGVAAQPRLIVYPVSVALTVIVAILAAYPLRRLVQIRPASVFRGEE
ncbi:MAG TPA: ABC transporter permease [Candidatus Eisenbacteria bacterium]|nr:ABC transporter permease [Candidatus Eisenbacteria bacterium]